MQKPPRFGAWLAWLVALTLGSLLVGCGAESALSVSRWTLVTGGAPGDVELPARLDDRLPTGPSRYVLASRVTLPPELRGRPLTLAIPFFEGPTTLRANGRVAVPFDPEGPHYRSRGAQAFRIDAEATTASPELSLELEIDHAFTRSAWFDSVPRLSATPGGDSAFRAVRFVNQTVGLVTLGVLFGLGTFYAVAFAFDRSRRAHGWFALQALGVFPYALASTGWTRDLLGPYDQLTLVALYSSNLSSLFFTHSHFRLGPVPRAFPWGGAALMLVFALWPGMFDAPRIAVRLMVLLCTAAVVYQVAICARVARTGERRDRAAAIAFCAAWLGLLALAHADVAWLLGLGRYVGSAHFLLTGIVLFSLVQASVLGRDHAASLVATDALNVELAAKVRTLETSTREVGVLNDELRRQVADRSQKLAEALARVRTLPSGAASLASGDVVHGRYRVVRTLGEGGMGAVYEVRRLTDDRRLALKVLRGATTGRALARFAREGQIAAQLAHPSLVGVVDIDVADSGAMYLVMELVDGSSLDDPGARRHGTSWVLAVLRQVASGLAALHEAGIVHRDLKPANVLIDRHGEADSPRARIADFGIAKEHGLDAPPPVSGVAPTLAATDPHATTMSVDRDDGSATAPAISAAAYTAIDSQPAGMTPLTQTGALIGTPLYMAPELATGAASGPASDLWSFGVMALELLLGRYPFRGPPVLLGWSTPPSLAECALDVEIEGALLRCLDPDPSRRPTAREVADTLSRNPA